MSDEPVRQLECTTQFREVLSVGERNPPIDQVLAHHGLLSRFVQLLSSCNHQLQFEAAWVLTNITSGSSEQTVKVIESGAVAVFIELLGSANSHDDVKEQVITITKPFLSCLVLSCLVLSCLVLSCLVLSCLVLSCLVLSCFGCPFSFSHFSFLLDGRLCGLWATLPVTLPSTET